MPWYNPAWTKRKKITIDPTKVGAGGVANFPVLVELDATITAGMRSDAADLVFTASDGTTKLSHDVERDFCVSGNGVWNGSWPSSVRVGSKTYIAYVTRAGIVMITEYDHTAKTSKSRVLRTGVVGADDHCSPTIVVLPSGRLCSFYAQHGGSGWVSLAPATNPMDSAWTETDLTPLNNAAWGAAGWAYMWPCVTSDGTIHLFWRGNGFRPAYATTTEAGLTTVPGGWSTPVQFWITGAGAARPYLRPFAKGLDVHLTGMPDNPEASTPNDIYYCRLNAGTLYRADGTVIGTVAANAPFETSTLEKVWNASTDGTAQYGSPTRADYADIVVDEAGTLAIVWTAFPGSTITTAPDSRYWYARWTGSAWDKHEIVRGGTTIYTIAGNVWYIGRLSIDPRNANAIVYSTNYALPTHTVYSAVTADGGATWVSTLLRQGPEKSFRPVITTGWVDDELRIVYCAGEYTEYTNYGCGIYTPTALDVPSAAHLIASSLSSVADPEIFVYYGNAAALDQSDPASAWPIAGYQKVYHLGRDSLSDLSLREAISGSCTGLLKTASAATQDALATTAPKLLASGKVLAAQTCATNGSQVLGSILNLSGVTAFTVSCWIKPAATGVQTLISNWQSAGTYSGIMIRVQTTNTLTVWIMCTGNVALQCTLTFAASSLNGSVFRHLVVTYDSAAGGLKGYLDGVLGTTAITAGSVAALNVATTPAFRLGDTPHTTGVSFNGPVDELRFAVGAARSAAWALTEYNNQNSPSTFYALGAEEAPEAPSGRRRLLGRFLLR